tara:strand:- start:1314 stop:1913 length:600 start_codon:yes stop_codon:yes gene_type:complete
MTQTNNTATPDYIVDGVLTDGEAWVALSTVDLGSDTATITFQTSTGANEWSQYSDLVLVSYVRSAASDTVLKMNFNNDTAANYGVQQLYSNGSSLTASESAPANGQSYYDFQWMPVSGSAANVWACSVTTLFDINSGKAKAGMGFIADDLTSGGYASINAGCWYSADPIEEIDIVGYSGGDIVTGSRFDLFGVLPRMVS